MQLTHTKEQLDAALAEIYSATRNHAKNGGEGIALMAYCLVLTALSVKRPETSYNFVEEDLIELVKFFFKAATIQESSDRPGG